MNFVTPDKVSTHSAHSDNCYFHFSIGFLIELKFCKVYEILFQTNAESFIAKKYFLGRCQYQNKKALFTDSIFSEGFGPRYIK